MRKQDKQGVRTPADLERKYHFGKNMGAAQKAASDATRAAERAVAAAGNALGRDEYDQIVAMLNRAHTMITRLVVQSGDFSLDAQGNMTVKNIIFNGKNLESRIAAIEEMLGISGGDPGGDDPGGTTPPTTTEIDEGQVTVGDTWLFMDIEYVDEWSVTSITGGISRSDTDDGIYLTAVSAGVAYVTAQSSDGKTTVRHKYTVIEKSGGTHQHTETTLAAVAATCTTTGLTEGKQCSVCGETTVAQNVIPAKGHTEVTDAAVAATCTKTGLTAGKHCSVCNAVLVSQEVTDMIPHQWGEPYMNDNAPDGWAHKCVICGKEEWLV